MPCHIILLYIYQTLIHPHLNYALAVYGEASKTPLNITILQKKELCIMHFMDIREYEIPLFINADTSPVTFRRFMLCSEINGFTLFVITPFSFLAEGLPVLRITLCHTPRLSPSLVN